MYVCFHNRLLLFNCLFLYLAAPGLSCNTWDFWSSFQHAESSAACGIFSCNMHSLSCSMWHLASWPGIKPRPPALGAWSLSHSTTREVPHNSLLLPKAFHCMSHLLCGTSREICSMVTPRDAEDSSGNWIHFTTLLHLVGGHPQAKERGLRRNYPCPLLDLGPPARKAVLLKLPSLWSCLTAAQAKQPSVLSSLVIWCLP